VAFTVWKYRFRGFVCCIVILVVLAGIYSATGSGRRIYLNRDLDTFSGRTTLWQFELRQLVERPLLGYGYDVGGRNFQRPVFPGLECILRRTAQRLPERRIRPRCSCPGVLAFCFLSPWVWSFVRGVTLASQTSLVPLGPFPC
jgi:hypothetical protein